MKMKAYLKAIYNAEPKGLELEDIPTNSPVSWVYICLEVGTNELKGADIFYLEVVSPSWIKQELEKYPILSGRHYLILEKWNYDVVLNYINKYLEKCTGENWDEIGPKVARIAKWEFEDYQPYVQE